MQESTLKRSGTTIARDATCVAGGLAQRAPDDRRSSTVSSIGALSAHFAAGIACSWAVGSVTPTRSRRGVRRRKFPPRQRFCAKVEQKSRKSGASRKSLLWNSPILNLLNVTVVKTPARLLSTQPPVVTVPTASKYVPGPLARPLTKQPWCTLPLGRIKSPSPCGTPASTSPIHNAPPTLIALRGPSILPSGGSEQDRWCCWKILKAGV